MLRVDCYDFYKLGVQINPLTLIPDSATLEETWISLYLAKQELDTFFSTFPLKTSRTPATELYQAIIQLIPEDLTHLKLNGSEGVARDVASEVGKIKRAAKEFETVLKAELGGWDAFFVSQKGAFSTSDLIYRAEMMLVESAHIHLSKDAREDIRQSGRCLAFNLGTAAAFHMVRAVETFIWKYYESVVGHLPPVKMRNWGAYIRNLEKCKAVDHKVLGWMRQIKEEYRNPIFHPVEVLTSEDALEFMNACLSLMAAISRALKKNGESAAPQD